MKPTKILANLFVALGLIVLPAKVSHAAPVGTAFTYQGHLYDANQVANGLYDFQFKLFDAAPDGNQIGGDVNKPDVDVIDAQFTVELDFGNVFDGDARWLEIGVRPGDQNDPCTYTILEPRQEVTPTPYALQTRGIFVDESGNVGIGTTIPAEKLHVEGSAYISDNLTVGTPVFIDGINERIGIGTNSPEKELHIYTDMPDPAAGILVEHAEDGGVSDIQLKTGNGIWSIENEMVSGDKQLQFAYNNVHKVVIENTENGNNGCMYLKNTQYNKIVGTGYSDFRICAESNAAISGARIILQPNSCGWRPGDLWLSSSRDTANTWSEHIGDIEFYHETVVGGVPTSVSNMIIRGNTGNVGIATIDPTEKLDINGKVRVRDLPSGPNLVDVVVADTDGVLHKRDASTLGGAFPPPAYDSGWVAGDGNTTIFHNLGGNVDNYVVDIQIMTPSGGIASGQGLYYGNLTTSSVDIYIYSGEGKFGRVRIWVYE